MRRAIALFSLALACQGAPPEVLKVEPPNWWAAPGSGSQPLRLLVRGRHLSGARAQAARGCPKAAVARVNAAGTYAFVEIEGWTKAAPRPCPILLTTADGSAAAPFEYVKALPAQGRFQGFSQDDVIYLLMPDRFSNGDPANDDPAVSRGLFDKTKPRYYHGGDLQGVIDRLPYLRELGVTAIWLNPWYDNANRLNERERYNGQPITDYHGYGAVDFYAVDEHLGDLAKLRELVDRAHATGIKVMQDQVANHTGPYHPWVQDPPTPTWYYGTEKRHLANTWQTWTLADPYATPEMQRATLEGWFLDILPDLNQDDPECARYLIQNTLWWIGMTGIDGIRQDTLPYVHRRFWREWTAAIKKAFPNVKVVGEMFDGNPALVSFFQGGRQQFDGIDSGIDTVFDFPTFYPIRRAFAEGRPIRELAQMVSHDRLYPNPEVLVTFLGLHDVERFMNVKGATADGLKLAFTFLMTARGTPLIYYGDEIAMPGGNDPDNRRDFPTTAFDATGRTPEQESVFQYVRKLALLRTSRVALRRGRMANLYADASLYAYSRAAASGETAVVVINNSGQPRTVEFAVPGLEKTKLEDALGGSTAQVNGGRARVELPARTAAVYF